MKLGQFDNNKPMHKWMGPLTVLKIIFTLLVLTSFLLALVDGQWNRYGSTGYGSIGGYGGGYVVPIRDELCQIPHVVQGEWYSREDGQNVITRIGSSDIDNRGRCLAMASEPHSSDNYTLVLYQDSK